MIVTLSSLFLSLSASTAFARPQGPEKRTVSALDPVGFEAAQQRDDTATRVFSNTEIKTSDGQCLFIDELSGDDRANFTPIQVAACTGDTAQLWDIITAGVHDKIPGTILLVNTLTQTCINFDPRRAAPVIMFSCGGRADGGGSVTNSQTFNLTSTSGGGPLALTPLNAVGTCFTVTSANVIDQAPCNPADPNQAFIFAGSVSVDFTPTAGIDLALATSIASTAPSSSTGVVSIAPIFPLVSLTTTPSSDTGCPAPTIPASSPLIMPTTISTVIISASSAAATAPAELNTSGVLTFNPTTPVTVSGAGGILQPSAATESNPRDETATRFLSSVPIKAPNGQCLFVNPTAGDFRENLIQIQTADCTGSPNELFDVITAGVHNNAPNSTLIVSTLTQGCLNFDPRRAVGNTVILFSCGGRADGGGTLTNSQLFPFNGTTTLTLEPENDVSICLDINADGLLDSAPCSGDGSQVFTLGP